MSEKREVIKSYPVGVGTVHLLANGIAEMRFNEEYIMDLEALENVQTAVNDIALNQDIYLLVIPGPGGIMTKEAREAPMFKNSRTKAIAIMVTMIHHRILGNIYFKFKKAEFKNYKLFKKEANAQEWLLQQMNKD